MPGYDSDPGAGPVRALIVDDEASARSRLRRHLAACPQVVIEGEADNGIAALEKIIAVKPDLLFLDIQMPGMTGFEVLRNLPPDLERPHIVFVTGYDQHALDAFEADAIAYLLKPVQQQRLIQWLNESSASTFDHPARELSAWQPRFHRRCGRSSCDMRIGFCFCGPKMSCTSISKTASLVHSPPQNRTRSTCRSHNWKSPCRPSSFFELLGAR
jgi:CheY-like chemotaxis protein